jgi:hypothetical protein
LHYSEAKNFNNQGSFLYNSQMGLRIDFGIILENYDRVTKI